MGKNIYYQKLFSIKNTNSSIINTMKVVNCVKLY